MKPIVVVIGLALLTLVLFVASLLTGRAGALPMLELLTTPGAELETPMLILREVRLPRSLLAVLIGASLGLGGAALQGYLRNPLADPGLVGASASGALGAVLVFYSGALGSVSMAVPLAGVIGALSGLAAVLAIAGRDATPQSLILAGVAVNTLATALTALALNLAPSPYAALEIIFWLLGSLADRSVDHVLLMLPFAALGACAVMSCARALDALTLGEDTATTLGFSPTRTRWLVVGGTGAAVGAGVAVSGAIGFIGLVVPHMLRPLVGQRPSALLVPSALGGAALTLAADMVVRALPTNIELKLGVVTALIGAPLFLLLLYRYRRGAA